MPCFPLPSLPQTENWVFAMLLGLFALLVLAMRAYPALMTDDLPSIFRIKERSSLFGNSEGSDSRLRVLYLFFACCTIGLYAYVAFFQNGTAEFAFTTYLGFVAVTAGFLLLKGLIIRLLCYTFFEGRTLQLSLGSYHTIVMFLGLTLFPLLAIRIYASPSVARVACIAGLVACCVAAMFVILKLFQIFYSKLLDFLYILLYLCTLEILPFAALLQAYRLIV